MMIVQRFVMRAVALAAGQALVDVTRIARPSALAFVVAGATVRNVCLVVIHSGCQRSPTISVTIRTGLDTCGDLFHLLD